MVRFEGEFHGLPRTGKPRNREERLKRILAWLETAKSLIQAG